MFIFIAYLVFCVCLIVLTGVTIYLEEGEYLVGDLLISVAVSLVPIINVMVFFSIVNLLIPSVLPNISMKVSDWWKNFLSIQIFKKGSK